jgi:hypothetical protein
MNPTRRSGLIYMLIWGAVAAVLARYMDWLGRHHWQIIGYGWFIPGALFLAGLVQFVSGVPFSELSSKWDALEGWQRGVLGTVIFLVSVIFIFACAITFAIVKYGT